ncbi:MAG TPA: glycosyltransferase family 4 protein, partial [Chloroflexota bacterium]|nr:glycosyltransferase family 4 protein [Chloroflexota bacterium]
PVGNAGRLLDAHNAVWTIIARAQQTASPLLKPLLAREARLLKRYEGALCRQMDAVLAVSEVDRQSLIAAGACPEKVHVIPIAVDCEALQPLARDERDDRSKHVITLGTLFYPPNADGVRWFLREVFPLIQKARADFQLSVVGPRPPADIVQFGARHAPSVTVTGYVPDLLPYLARAAVMVVPVRAASGMRVRILEALARGMPVVSTTMGVEGIDAAHGEHLLVADEPEAFAQAVVRLLDDPPLRKRLARNGRRLAEQRYDWRVVLPALEAVYHSLVPSSLAHAH